MNLYESKIAKAPDNCIRSFDADGKYKKPAGAVTRRYAPAAVQSRLFTLIHRKPEQKEKAFDWRKSQLSSYFHLQLADAGKRTLDKATAVFTRRVESMEKAMSSTLHRELSRQNSAWREFDTRMVKAQSRHFRATDKRLERAFAETETIRLEMRRGIDRIERREMVKARELEMTPREKLPVSAGDAARMIEDRLEKSSEDLKNEIDKNARRSAVNALRRAREEEEYERMRRGERGYGAI